MYGHRQRTCVRTPRRLSTPNSKLCCNDIIFTTCHLNEKWTDDTRTPLVHGWSSYLDDDREDVTGVGVEVQLTLVGEVVRRLVLDVEIACHVTRIHLHMDSGSWRADQRNKLIIDIRVRRST